MGRLLLTLLAAGGCHSYSSGQAGSDLILAAAAGADAALDDCDRPRTSFRPTGSASPSPLVGVATVYRGEPPRRPYAVFAAMRASVSRDSECAFDLVAEIRGRAAAAGCDAVHVSARETTSGRLTVLDGSCLVFSR
jgi:hypothetical protein